MAGPADSRTEARNQGGDRGLARVKGTLVITLMKFIRAQALDPGSVLARLPAPDQLALREILLPSSWYPADLFSRLQDATVASLPRWSRTECLVEMGRFSAQTNLGPGGVRRAYIREGDPHHVLEAVPRIYEAVYTAGQRTYERTGERSAVIRGYDNGFCAWAVGWLQRLVELSGGRDVTVVEAQCRSNGAPHCTYELAWR